MNVALIALSTAASSVIPPLTLAYIAGVLEQRRHIVRIYDLALTPDVPLSTAFRPLRAFRPQAIVVASEQLLFIEQALEILHDQHMSVLPLRLKRDSLAVSSSCAYVLTWLGCRRGSENDIAVNETLYEPPDRSPIDLDKLPFPARHLLSLEAYNLRAVGGELQTTLLVGASEGEEVVLRTPAQIVAELRSVSRECGIRHYLFPGIPLTTDRAWLQELLTRLDDAQLGISWEATVNAESLDKSLLMQMAQAGCEKLCFSLTATRVFESATARERLKQIVTQAHQYGIYARADLNLEPPYEAIPYLVDVAATFGLDDVSFNVCNPFAQDQSVSDRTDDNLRLEFLARQRYDVGRSRQRMIERYGPALGALIWKFSNWWLLGRVAVRKIAGLEEREDLARSV
ncbi:MAG: hypothetical protein MI924_20630 [Chloroflexales bacterium]|nr:hypothetical protein [Chloroflexales bacterium]